MAEPKPRGSAPPTTGPVALRQIREAAHALLAQGKVEETRELFLAALEAVLVKNRELELLVAKLRRERLGTTSERLDPAQLSLLLEALSDQAGPEAASDPEADAREDAELDREIESAEQAAPAATRKPRKAGPGWQTRGVERQVHQVEVPAAQRTCTDCGRALTRIGEDITRRLEYVPAHFVEHEYHLDKYAGGARRGSRRPRRRRRCSRAAPPPRRCSRTWS